MALQNRRAPVHGVSSKSASDLLTYENVHQAETFSLVLTTEGKHCI